jgi:hypothetical protein
VGLLERAEVEPQGRAADLDEMAQDAEGALSERERFSGQAAGTMPWSRRHLRVKTRQDQQACRTWCARAAGAALKRLP